MLAQVFFYQEKIVQNNCEVKKSTSVFFIRLCVFSIFSIDNKIEE